PLVEKVASDELIGVTRRAFGWRPPVRSWWRSVSRRHAFDRLRLAVQRRRRSRAQAQGTGLRLAAIVDRFGEHSDGFLVGVEAERILATDKVEAPHGFLLKFVNRLELLGGGSRSL